MMTRVVIVATPRSNVTERNEWDGTVTPVSVKIPGFFPSPHFGMRAGVCVAPARFAGTLRRAPTRAVAGSGARAARCHASTTKPRERFATVVVPILTTLVFLTAHDDAQAFVPITGCGDPGSPYDTGVVSADTKQGGKLRTCVKLYQPARDAERRAAEASKVVTKE